AYDSARLANLGIGHGAIDAGVGYTYFDQKTGHEFSAVTGLTYNLPNQSTNYQNGVDWHLDWAASQFLSNQLSVGVVGYVYKEIGCDSGSGDRVGSSNRKFLALGHRPLFCSRSAKNGRATLTSKAIRSLLRRIAPMAGTPG